MESKAATSRDLVKVMLFAALIGALSGVVVLVFLTLMRLGIGFVWERLPLLFGLFSAGEPAPAYVFAVATLGGLVVGILVRIFGDQPALFAELMAELRGLIGGLGLGIVGALLPLTLFSGEHEL